MKLQSLHIGIVSNSDRLIKMLSALLQANTNHYIDWACNDPVSCFQANKCSTPNLILIDISNDDLNGAALTKKLIDNYDTNILLVCTSVSKDASKVFEAMGNGALDVIAVPDDLDPESNDTKMLIQKVTSVCKLIQPGTEPVKKAPKPNKSVNTLIAIGSSTGGPTALASVLKKLPTNLNAAIVVIQHVDFRFAETLASWLNDQIPLPVKLAKNGDYPEPGTVLLAATNDHLRMRQNQSLTYSVEPADYSYRPSIDVFFNSAVQYWKGSILGVLLTGMGRDGAIGLRAIRDRGLHTIAQDKDSCVVYGMPKAAAELKAACKILDIDAIGDEINQQMVRSNNIKKKAS